MINVKIIEKNDLDLLEKIGKVSLPIYYDSSNLDNMIYDRNYLLLKANKNNKIVGFIFSKLEEDNIHIISFAVLPEMRNKGIGTKLINTLKSFNYFSSITLNVLETNLQAINFYYKNNFKKEKILLKYYTTLNNSNALFLKYCNKKNNLQSRIDTN